MESTPPRLLSNRSRFVRFCAGLLPTARFSVWWVAVLLTFLWFDLSWCSLSTFRPFTAYLSTYVTLFAAATLFSMPAALSRRIWPQAVVLGLLDMFFVANLMYARTYMGPIPLDSYMLAGNLSGFEGAVAGSVSWGDLLFPAITASGAVVAALCPPRSLRGRRAIWGYLIVLAASLGMWYVALAGRGGFKTRMETMSKSVSHQQAPPVVYSLFATLAYDLATRDEPLSPGKRQLVADWMAAHHEVTGGHASHQAPPAAPRNVVMLLCESLESWPVGLVVEGREVTPFLNSLAADTIANYYNPNVVTQVGDGRSIDGQLLYLAGQYPLSSGVYSVKYAGNRFFTFPQEMSRAGGRTYLLSADVPSTWNQGAVARAFGFGSLSMADSWHGAVEGPGPGAGYVADGPLMSQAVAKMRDGEIWPVGERAFVMVVTHTGHAPFKLPDGYDTLGLEGDYPPLLADYLSTAHYVDASLKVMVEYIMSRPDAAETSVVIVGDHEGLATWRKKLSGSHGFVSDRPLTPLLVVNAPRPGHDSRYLGQVDVYSALLDIAGLYGTARWRGMGQSPFDPSHPGCAVASDGTVYGGELGKVPGHVVEAPVVGDLLMRYDLLPGIVDAGAE